MTDRLKTLWLGMFIIAAIGGAAWILLFLRPSVGDNATTLRVRFANIERISVGTRVTFAGKPVGEVVAIHKIEDARKGGDIDEEGDIYFYELDLKVDSGVHVYNYDEIGFATSGLLGERSIAIVPKAAPPGMPPAYEVTDDILYADSSDKLEEAVNQLIDVAENFEETLDKIGDFLDQNQEEVSLALQSFTATSDEVREVFARANETDFVGKAAEATTQISSAMGKADRFFGDALDQNLIFKLRQSIDQINTVTHRLASGQGTIGRLLNSNTLYFQLSSSLTKLDTALADINNYGLLFQFDSRWKRKRRSRMIKPRQLCNVCDFYNYFNGEIAEISVSLNRLAEALAKIECRDMAIDSNCFAERLEELLYKIKTLECSFNKYQECQ